MLLSTPAGPNLSRIATALLTILLTGCRPAPPTSPVAHFHNPDLGFDFDYPSTWKQHTPVHSAADLEAGHDCVLYISAMIYNGTETAAHSMDSTRSSMAQDHPEAKISDRPAWAGPVKPGASMQSVTTDAQGNRIVQYDMAFDQHGKAISMFETFRQGDTTCTDGLRLVESTFRLTQPSQLFLQ